MCNPKNERDAWLMLVTLQEIPLALLDRLEKSAEMEIDLSKSMTGLTNLQRGRYVALKVVKLLKELSNKI